MKPSLPSSEWVLVLSFLAILTSLVVIAEVNAYRASSTLSNPTALLRTEDVAVEIEGAVVKPGTYSVRPGTTIGEALRKARPKPWADLQKLSLNQPIEEPFHLYVEELTEITVSVRGEVATPTEVTLPAKSRVCDLKSKVFLTEKGDPGFFKRKRRLKHGEIIEVPKKTVE